MEFHKFLHSQCQLYLYAKNPASNLVENTWEITVKCRNILFWKSKWTKGEGDESLALKGCVISSPLILPPPITWRGRELFFFLNMSLNSEIYSIISYCKKKKIVIYYFLESLCEHFVAIKQKELNISHRNVGDFYFSLGQQR